MAYQIYIGILLSLVYLSLMFLIIQLKRDNSLGNFTWGVGCVLITLYTFFINSAYLPRHILITSLVTLWGIRLGTYFYSRYKPGADPRFISWQASGGPAALFFSFAWIFLGQATLMIIMSLPSIAVNFSRIIDLNWLDILATITWSIGFYFESIGDWQLHKFMKNPENKGKVLKSGLWRYTRHPNYFGEILMWWSIFLIALSVPYGIFTVIAPLTITILLRYFTGVPMLEKSMQKNPEYQQYQKTTNMLIPGLPKANNHNNNG